jgi:uncharacterized membrane protein YjfL (UPF0719 family)
MSGYFSDIVYFGACLILLAFARFIYSIFNPKTDYSHLLGKEKNIAFTIGISGYLIGSTIVIAGALNKDLPLQEGLFEIAIFGFGGIICLNLTDYIFQWLHIPKATFNESITKNEIGAGIIQFSIYSSIAMMIYASSVATHENYWGALGLTLGLIILVVLHYYYSKVLRNDLDTESLGSSLSYGSILISAGILFANAFSAGFHDYTDLIYISIITLFWIMIIIPLFQILLFKVMIGKLNPNFVNESPKPIIIGLLECFTYIGVTTLLALSFYP